MEDFSPSGFSLEGNSLVFCKNQFPWWDFHKPPRKVCLELCMWYEPFVVSLLVFFSSLSFTFRFLKYLLLCYPCKQRWRLRNWNFFQVGTFLEGQAQVCAHSS